MAAAKKTLVAVTSLACDINGVTYVVREGETVAANHPAVKGREALFETHDPNRPTAA